MYIYNSIKIHQICILILENRKLLSCLLFIQINTITNN